MATTISGDNYKSIANDYGNLREQVIAATDYLLLAVETIVQLDDIEPTVDLLQTFYDTYNIQTTSLRASTPYLSAVKALNNHCLARGRDALNDPFVDIAAWLDYNLPGGPFTPVPNDLQEQQLKEAWIDLCYDAGFIKPSEIVTFKEIYCSDCA